MTMIWLIVPLVVSVASAAPQPVGLSRVAFLPSRGQPAPIATIGRPMSSTGTQGGVGIAHQDPCEIFDLYRPPQTPNTVVADPPSKTGERKKRSEVHRDGDWHRSIHVWLVDSAGNVLLQRRSAGKDTHPNLLDVSCAGHVTSGDEVDATAVRELEEELGLKGVEIEEMREGRAFTIAASIEGTAGLHGRFVCREFQEVYVLHREDPLVATSFVPDSEEEVAGFEVVTVNDVLGRLRAGDGELVPRSRAYVDALAKVLH